MGERRILSCSLRYCGDLRDWVGRGSGRKGYSSDGRISEVPPNRGWKAALTRPLESGRYVAQPFQAAGHRGFPAPNHRCLTGSLAVLPRACLRIPLSVGRGVRAEPGWVNFKRRRLIGTIRPTFFGHALRFFPAFAEEISYS